jgi:Transcriptional regulators
LESDELIKECLRRLNRTTALFSRSFDCPGYTFNEMNVLGTIVRNPGIIARDICGYNVIDRGYLSKILKKLEQNGLILRAAKKRPPFGKVLSATLLGEKKYSEAELLVDQSIAERLSVLHGTERASFSNCVSEMLQYLKKIAPDVPKYTADAEDCRR